MLKTYLPFSISPSMREYKFKRGYKPTKERLEQMIVKYFGEFKKEGDVYIVKYGAIEELRLWLKDKKLYAQSKTNPHVPEDVAIKTIKTYNKFLEELTGYSAKERQKQLRKEVEQL